MVVSKIEGHGTRGRGERRLHKVCSGTPPFARVPSLHDFSRPTLPSDVPSTPYYA